MDPGHGFLTLQAVANCEGFGARADLAARMSQALSLGAYGSAIYDYRAQSLDWQAGLAASLRW